MKRIQVEIRPGVFVAHTLAEYARLWKGVDREAAEAMVAPLEDDKDAPGPEA